jgi:hypothetical protein
VWNGAQWVPLPAAVGSTYRLAFTDAALVAGVLTVTHALGLRYNTLAVYTNLDKFVVPDDITDIDANTITVELSSMQAANGGALPGTWNVVVVS